MNFLKQLTMINKISDIIIGNEYYICIVRDKKLVKKCLVKSIINEKKEFNSNRTEIHIELLNKKVKSKHLFYMKEIGIGETKIEAFLNYGRFDYEENNDFDKSYSSTQN